MLCFQHTVSVIGEPPRPVSDVDWDTVDFGKIPEELSEEVFVCICFFTYFIYILNLFYFYAQPIWIKKTLCMSRSYCINDIFVILLVLITVLFNFYMFYFHFLLLVCPHILSPSLVITESSELQLKKNWYNVFCFSHYFSLFTFEYLLKCFINEIWFNEYFFD